MSYEYKVTILKEERPVNSGFLVTACSFFFFFFFNIQIVIIILAIRFVAQKGLVYLGTNM